MLLLMLLSRCILFVYFPSRYPDYSHYCYYCCCCCCCCCYCCCCCVCVCVCACVCFQLLVQSRLRSIGFIRRRFAGFLRQCQRFMLAPFFLVDRICVVRHHFVVQFGISRSYRSHRLHLLTPSPIPNPQSPISFYTPTRLFSLV